MSDQIRCREADAEKVGRDRRCRAEVNRRRRGEPADVGVGERAARPLRAEVAIRRLVVVAVQDVRKGRRPAARRCFALAVVHRRVAFSRQPPVPRLAEIGVDGIGGEQRLDSGHALRRKGRRRLPLFVVLVHPRHRVAAMAGEHDRAACLQRDGRDARASAARPQLIGEGWQQEPCARLRRRRCRSGIQAS